MTREERKEYNEIKKSLKQYELGYGTTLTIRTDASPSYKRALNDLYAENDFHPASVTTDDRRFDGKERIVYIKGVTTDDGKNWTAFYSKQEIELFEAKLDEDNTPKKVKPRIPKYEARYIVTDIVPIPVVRLKSIREIRKMATEADCYSIYKDDQTGELFCQEDNAIDFYGTDGSYYGLSAHDMLEKNKIPTDLAAIVISDGVGFTLWENELNSIQVIISRDCEGYIDTYRLEYNDKVRYDGEEILHFEDLPTEEQARTITAQQRKQI